MVSVWWLLKCRHKQIQTNFESGLSTGAIFLFFKVLQGCRCNYFIFLYQGYNNDPLFFSAVTWLRLLFKIFLRQFINGFSTSRCIK